MNPGEVAALILGGIAVAVLLAGFVVATVTAWRFHHPAALGLKCLRCGSTFYVTPDADRTCPACAAARKPWF